MYKTPDSNIQYKIMRTNDHLEDFEQELSAVKWDIIGPSETRLSGKKKCKPSTRSYTKITQSESH